MADGSTFPRLTVGKYQPNHPEVLAGIADYDGDREAYEDLYVVSCCQGCGYRAWVGRKALSDCARAAGFDTDIHDRDGALVCEDCAPGYVEEASYDPIREHGTYSI